MTYWVAVKRKSYVSKIIEDADSFHIPHISRLEYREGRVGFKPVRRFQVMACFLWQTFD
jgi:hypothetical protein